MDPRILQLLLGSGHILMGPEGPVMMHSADCPNGAIERPAIVGMMSAEESAKAQEAEDFDAQISRFGEQIRMLKAKKQISEMELRHTVQDRIGIPPNKALSINADTREIVIERVVAEGLNLKFKTPGEVEGAESNASVQGA